MLALGNAAALYGAPAANADSSARNLVWLLPPLTLVLMALWGLYRDRIHVRLVDGLGQVIAATSLAAISLIAVAALVDPAADAAPLLARAWLFGTLYLAGGRILLGWAQRRARATALIAKPTLIVGAGLIGAHVERRLTSQPQLGLRPVGYLDSDPPPADMVPDRQAPVLGAPTTSAAWPRETRRRHVVLGFSTAPDRLLMPLVRECEALGLEVSLVPRLFESVNVRVALEHLGGLPLFGLHTIDPKGWQFAIKHVLDRIVAALPCCSCSRRCSLALALAVRLSSPGPVLFRQRRHRPRRPRFEMLKFRSMAPRTTLSPRRCPTTSSPCASDLGPGGVEGADRRTRVGHAPAPHLARRAAAALQRPARRDEPGRAAARAARVRRRSSARGSSATTTATASSPGITGWAQVHGLRGQTSLARPGRVGQLLHRELVALARPEDPPDDAHRILPSRGIARRSA